MNLSAQVQLLPNSEQAEYLQQSLERANAACNTISDYAWQQRKFGAYALQKALYYDIRERFDLTAQVVIRCFSKVGDAYKKDRRTKRRFAPDSAIAYDDRILNWRLPSRSVSIWTVGGRLSIPFVCGERQWELLQTQQGESDLAYVGGKFYLFAACHIDEPDPRDVAGVLGVDLGITNIAVDSDGNFYSGKGVTNVRYRHRRLRQRLQSTGTKSSRRRLKKLAGKEYRFANNTNHCISKQLVKTAQGTGRAIALENLKGIRARVTVMGRVAPRPKGRSPDPSSQRASLHSWAFAQLQDFIQYKAKLAGVLVILVDPRNTSRTCPNPECGCVDERNRKSQDVFRCIQCGYAGRADYFAALEIGRRGAVHRPHVSDTTAPLS